MGLKERREREREERRMQIRNAARGLLISKGLAATSINQIAKKAELGVGTIYFYYRSKEELFAALQQEGLELLAGKIAEASKRGKDPADKVKRTAMAYLRFSEENKDYFDIMNYFLASPEEILAPELKKEVDERVNGTLLFVQDIIQEGRSTGVFTNVDPRRASIMLWGALHGLIQFRKMKDTLFQNENYEKIYRYAVDHLVQSLTQ